MEKIKNDIIDIWIGDKGYIDFAYPVHMSGDQRRDFVILLKQIFNPKVIKDIPVKEFNRDWRIGEKKLYFRKWIAEEYSVLFECDTTKEIVESLGRSWQACELKDGDWRYRLVAFCDKNGYDLSSKDKLSIIKKFIKAQEEFNKFRKDLRKERTNLQKELENSNSPERKKIIQLHKKLGIGKDQINELNERKKDIRKRLKQIKIELEKSFGDSDIN